MKKIPAHPPGLLPRRRVAAVAQALADEGRLRVLCALQKGELCVCQIVELLNLSPSTVSKHMAILAQAGLVEARKDGRWVYYRLVRKGAASLPRAALKWAVFALDGDPAAEQDQKRLRTIMSCNPAELCRKQKNKAGGKNLCS